MYLWLLSLIITLSASISQAQSQALGYIHGKPITPSHYQAAVESLGQQGKMIQNSPTFRKKFLHHMIDSELLAREAQKQDLQNSPLFKKRLAALERDLLASLYMEKYLKQQTSDKKLQVFFDKNKENLAPTEIKASHILLPTSEQQKAKTILKEALAGKDFSSLAQKHSTGPTAAKGGDLGYFKKGRMVAAFDKAAFATPKGHVHPKLVQTSFGWHIIKVFDIKGQEGASFQSKKPLIKKVYSKQLRQEHIAQLRKAAKVRINEKALEQLPTKKEVSLER